MLNENLKKWETSCQYVPMVMSSNFKHDTHFEKLNRKREWLILLTRVTDYWGGGSAPASFQTLTNCIASQIINITGSIISISRLALDNCWNYIVYIRRMDTSMTSKVNDICPYITMQKLLQMIAKTRSNVYKISKHCWYFRRKNDVIKFWCHIA